MSWFLPIFAKVVQFYQWKNMTPHTKKKRLALLASGSGTNVANFIRYFDKHPEIEIALVVTNNPNAFVLERALNAGIPSAVIRGKQWKDETFISGFFAGYDIDLIVLAGFLLLIPSALVKRFEGRIVNIHPALLPGFGGKGMFGMHVHKAVIESGATESGITIHYVNEEYDKGAIIYQERIAIEEGETPESLASRIHELEYRHYPRVVEACLL